MTTGKRARGAVAARPPEAMSIVLPPIAIPSVTLVQAPPALITRRNAEHVGMAGPEFLRTLRAMRADPRFRDAVIVHGKSFRAASPEAVVAYLRAVPPGAANEAESDDLLRELGYERTPRALGAARGTMSAQKGRGRAGERGEA